MKLSRRWLNEFVDVSDISNKEYAHRMTMSGSIVEGTDFLGGGIEGVVVGKVLEIGQHPNADKLFICKVDTGSDNFVTIVTGAKNVRAGHMVPVALVGAKLPGGIEISATDMRGVESFGMLCSFQELDLTEHNLPGASTDGILILNDGSTDISLEGVSLGDSIVDVLGLNDYVMDFEITSNRADCLSVIGLARETSAVFERPLKLETPLVKGRGADISGMLEVEIQSSLCKRYSARLVTDVNIAPSPAWLREKLHASGVRPINNIVDITNYVMLEYGQPMHAFDYACIDGGKIVIRTAGAGEEMDTLDGNSRKLNEGMLVIADTSKAIGVAGVMGGANSEITETTKTLVFESANFDGPSVRKTATALGMRTESSGRFEKGLDPESVIPALQRACELVELLGAGTVSDGLVDVNPNPEAPRILPLEPEKINALLGTDISEDFMSNALALLGFHVTDRSVEVPSWRGDVEGMADLAEEVARIYGYDLIPQPVLRGGTSGTLTQRQKAEKLTADLYRALGYSEIITYSFISPSHYDKICMGADSIHRKSMTILNPLGEDTSIMRTVSLPSMLEIVSRNFNNRNSYARLAELATVYTPTDDKLPIEKKVLTLGAYGDMDFFTLKGQVEALLKGLNVKNIRFAADTANPSYHPGRCAAVFTGDTELGVVGQVHPSVLKNFDVDTDVYAAELDFERIFAGMDGDIEYVPTARFPAVTRDLAVVCDINIPAGNLQDTVVEVSGNLLESVEIFDVYTGNQISQGKKSIALALVFRHSDRTLNDAEVDAVFASVIKALDERYGASMRS